MEVELEIGGTPERVWGVMTNISGWAETIGGIERIDIVQSDDGAEGSAEFTPPLAWDETRVMMGRSETQRMELTEVDADAYTYTIANESCGARMAFVHSIIAQSTGSSVVRIRVETEYLTWTSWMFSWMGYLMQGFMRKIMLQDLADIKSAVESK